MSGATSLAAFIFCTCFAQMCAIDVALTLGSAVVWGFGTSCGVGWSGFVMSGQLSTRTCSVVFVVEGLGGNWG